MGVDIYYRKDLNYVEIIYNGDIAHKDLIAAFETAFKTGIENNTMVYLADCSHLTGGHTVFDLYNLLDLYEENNVPHSLKEAIIIPDMDSLVEKVEFYEIAASNRGYNIKLFRTKDEALLWLSK